MYNVQLQASICVCFSVTNYLTNLVIRPIFTYDYICSLTLKVVLMEYYWP
jgi:hypothetical protein